MRFLQISSTTMHTINKQIHSEWHPEKRLIVTRIGGDVTQDDIKAWEASLHKALSLVEDNSVFKIFVNLHGFKAVNFEAHKSFRTIIPLTLAQYGWKVGYVDLFGEEAKALQLSNNRGISCVGAVHCHQDETKIALYQSNYSRPNEHFYTDPLAATAWIEDLSTS